MRGERGSISIYLLIIFAALLIFAGIMVDVARIMIAERKVYNAVQSTARSVLAGYEPVLAGQFGLFAVNHRKQAAELERYLRNNLLERHSGFTFIDYCIEKASVESLPSQTLLHNGLFEQQILEYMKYKAPLRATENVIQKFKAGALNQKAKAGESAVQAAKQSKEVRKQAQAFNKLLPAFTEGFPGKKEIDTDTLYSLQTEVSGIKKELNTYKAKLEESNNKFQAAGQALEQIGNITEKISPLNDQQWVKYLEDKIDVLEEDIAYNLKTMQQIERLKYESGALVDKTDDNSVKMKQQIAGQIQELTDKMRLVEKIDIPELLNPKVQVNNVKQKKDLLKKIQNLIGASLKNEEVYNYLISAEEFKLANTEEAQDENILFLNGDPAAGLGEMDLDNDIAETSGSALFKLLEDISQGLEKAAADSGKKIALCEYIMDKYTFVTSQTQRGHYFELGEVEYILCGNDSELANITEMFAKIFAVRLAINSLDAFLKSVIPEPIVRLAQALAAGFVGATVDMIKLYDGQAVELYPKIAHPSLSYSDYLRIFLLLQNKKTQLDRMRQLVQIDVWKVNEEFLLQEHGGVITVEAEVSINLLFLPVLHLDKLGFRNFTEDRFLISREVTVGY